VALIFQDFGQYLMSAADNIGLGDVTRFDDAEGIEQAARLAQADTFIRELPDAYDNLLGSEFYGGANLSLGQWQRIALARAFFRNAPFVILDEPTASLDPRAEAALFDSVRTLYAGRAVLLISHRFSSVRSADRIYVLDAGSVVEHGTHEQLMEEAGLYAELFELQASAYEKDGRHR
jgi:ATP-binding cassette subfamily B protein